MAYPPSFRAKAPQWPFRRFAEDLARWLTNVCGAALLLALLALPMLLVALLIRLEDRGPALFRQERVGLSGRRFTMLKFRTMTRGRQRQRPARADRAGAGGRRDRRERQLQDRRRPADHAGRGVPPPHQPRRASPADQRAARGDVPGGADGRACLGRRRSSPPEFADRFTVRPGLTGLWQVSGRSTVGTLDMLRMDVAYVRDRRLSWTCGSCWPRSPRSSVEAVPDDHALPRHDRRPPRLSSTRSPGRIPADGPAVWVTHENEQSQPCSRAATWSSCRTCASATFPTSRAASPGHTACGDGDRSPGSSRPGPASPWGTCPTWPPAACSATTSRAPPASRARHCTGRLLGAFRGIRRYTQYRTGPVERWHYGGSVFDDYEPTGDRRPPSSDRDHASSSPSGRRRSSRSAAWWNGSSRCSRPAGGWAGAPGPGRGAVADRLHADRRPADPRHAVPARGRSSRRPSPTPTSSSATRAAAPRWPPGGGPVRPVLADRSAALGEAGDDHQASWPRAGGGAGWPCHRSPGRSRSATSRHPSQRGAAGDRRRRRSHLIGAAERSALSVR